MGEFATSNDRKHEGVRAPPPHLEFKQMEIYGFQKHVSAGSRLLCREEGFRYICSSLSYIPISPPLPLQKAICDLYVFQCRPQQKKNGSLMWRQDEWSTKLPSHTQTQRIAPKLFTDMRSETFNL